MAGNGGGASEQLEQMRSGVRAQVVLWSRRATTSAHRLGPWAVVAGLTAGALAPVAWPLVIGGGAAAVLTGAIGQLGAIGSGYLTEVTLGAVERLKAGDESGPNPAKSEEALRRQIEARLLAGLQRGGPEFDRSRGAVSALLQGIGAVETAVAAAAAAGDRDAQQTLYAAFSALGESEAGFAWMLVDLRAVLITLQSAVFELRDDVAVQHDEQRRQTELMVRTLTAVQLLHRHVSASPDGRRVAAAAAGPAPVVQGGSSTDPDSPYPGLAAFEPADADRFFGRDALVAVLIAQTSQALSGPGVVAVVGPSGSGKSSLLRAGLLPALIRGQAPLAGTESWPWQLFTPGEHPLSELAMRVSALAGLPAPAVRSHLAADASGLRLVAGQALRAVPVAPGRRPEDARVVLIIDQFEELFTLCDNEAERRAFIAALYAAAGRGTVNSPPSVLVLIGLRADFYGHCAKYPELVELLADQQLLVGPMTEPELREAIERPALDRGARFADGLVELLVRDAGFDGVTGADDGSLPLVAHALAETWRRRSDGVLTVAAYQATGGIRGAVAATAETVYSSLDPERRRILRRVLIRMVKVEEGREDTRRRASRSALTETFGADGELVLNRLIAARLVTADRDSVQIAHEALLRAWPRLRGWLVEDRQDLVVRQELAEAAQAWRAQGRHPTALLQGPRLARIRALPDGSQAGKWRAELSDDEAEYLDASLVRARRTARRPYEAIAALVVALALAVSAGAYTITQRDQARQQRQTAQTAQLVAESNTLGQSDPRASLLLALDAYHQDPSSRTRSLLESELTQTRYEGTLNGTGHAVESVAYTPNGQVLATGDDKGTVILWSTATNRRLASLSTYNAISSMAIDHTGDVLAVELTSCVVELWDIADPAHPTRLGILNALGAGDDADGIGGASVAYSPNSDLLAATDGDGALTVWDASVPTRPIMLSQTLVLKVYPEAADGADGQLAFSRDGKTLVMGDVVYAIAVLWNMADPTRPQYIGILQSPDTSAQSAFVAYSPTEDLVATESGFADSTYLWDVSSPASPKLLATLTGQGDQVLGLAISHDGTRLAVAAGDDTTELWDIRTPARPVEVGRLRGQAAPVSAVAFSPDGHSLATGGTDGPVLLWNADENVGAPVLAEMSSPSAGTAPNSLAVEGDLLAVGNNDGSVDLWNIADPADPRRWFTVPFPTSEGRPSSVVVALSPDGRTLAIAYVTGVVLWDVSVPGRSAELGALPDGAEGVVAFSRQGDVLATSDEKSQVILFDLSEPSAPRLLGMSAPSATGAALEEMVFSPDGRTLAVGQVGSNLGGGLALFDVSDRNEPRPLTTIDRSDEAIYGVAFSPDGTTLASTTVSEGVLLWNITDPAHPVRLADLTANFGVTTGVDFGPDHLLATSGYDQNTVLWDVSDPAAPIQTLTLTGQTAAVGPVIFGTSGSVLATASEDSTTRLWGLGRLTGMLGQPVTVACQVADPGLMPPDWSAEAPGIDYQPGCGSQQLTSVRAGHFPSGT